MTVDNDAINHVYEAAQALEEFDDSEFLEVIEAVHGYEQTDEAFCPQYHVNVVIEDKNDPVDDSTYCYPIADYAREEWDLFLFDTVTDWEEQTIKLRLGYDAIR